jgi:hypothetical protein
VEVIPGQVEALQRTAAVERGWEVVSDVVVGDVEVCQAGEATYSVWERTRDFDGNMATCSTRCRPRHSMQLASTGGSPHTLLIWSNSCASSIFCWDCVVATGRRRQGRNMRSSR